MPHLLRGVLKIQQNQYPYYIKKCFSPCQCEGGYWSYWLMMSYDMTKSFKYENTQMIQSTLTKHEVRQVLRDMAGEWNECRPLVL